MEGSLCSYERITRQIYVSIRPAFSAVRPVVHKFPSSMRIKWFLLDVTSLSYHVFPH